MFAWVPGHAYWVTGERFIGSNCDPLPALGGCSVENVRIPEQQPSHFILISRQ